MRVEGVNLDSPRRGERLAAGTRRNLACGPSAEVNWRRPRRRPDGWLDVVLVLDAHLEPADHVGSDDPVFLVDGDGDAHRPPLAGRHPEQVPAARVQKPRGYKSERLACLGEIILEHGEHV